MGYGERGRGVKGLNDAEADARVGESFGGSTSGSGRRPQSVRHSGVGGITNVAMDERAFQLPD